MLGWNKLPSKSPAFLGSSSVNTACHRSFILNNTELTLSQCFYPIYVWTPTQFLVFYFIFLFFFWKFISIFDLVYELELELVLVLDFEFFLLGRVRKNVCFSSQKSCRCVATMPIDVISCGPFYIYKITAKQPRCYSRICLEKQRQG